MNTKHRKNIISSFAAEPYRLFFPLGIVSACIGVGYWLFFTLAATLGLGPSYDPRFHGLVQSELFCGAFAIGFLLTAIPRFSGTPSATPRELLTALLLYVSAAALLALDALSASQLVFSMLLISIILFGAVRFIRRKTNPPPSFILVALGLLQGALGAILSTLPYHPAVDLGKLLVEQGMLMSLTLGVGSFLGPRLMQSIETSNLIVSLHTKSASKIPSLSPPLAISATTGTLLITSYILESLGYTTTAQLMRAITVTIHLWIFKALVPPKRNTLIGTMISLAFWSICLGLWIPAFGASPASLVSWQHLLYISGFGVIILAIGAQVASSHGGDSQFWNTNRRKMQIILALLISAMLARISIIWLPTHFMLTVGSASLLFLSALILWTQTLFSVWNKRAAH